MLKNTLNENSLTPISTLLKIMTGPSLKTMRNNKEKIAALTCYDATFASLLDKAGIDVLLIGDSLGNVVQGHSTTIPVTIDDMLYHTHCVARGTNRAFLIADLPFGSYSNPIDTYNAAAKLMRAGAHMVKLEGGVWLAETIHFLVERAIPVCAHIGLTPQSVHLLGGYKVQGKTDETIAQMKKDALALEKAGAQLLVLEAVPANIAREITELLTIPTIGIGAGPDCSGQVLVLYDMLGITSGKRPRFVKDFMAGRKSIEDSIIAYIEAVKNGTFPATEHCFL